MAVPSRFPHRVRPRASPNSPSDAGQLSGVNTWLFDVVGSGREGGSSDQPLSARMITPAGWLIRMVLSCVPLLPNAATGACPSRASAARLRACPGSVRRVAVGRMVVLRMDYHVSCENPARLAGGRTTGRNRSPTTGAGTPTLPPAMGEVGGPGADISFVRSR